MPKSILIAEDYADCREFMKLLLSAYGYTVLEAVNGLEAVEIARHQIPDLILMDMEMPQMDGITATKIIRNLDDGSEVPIIAFTASKTSYHEEAIKAGCNEILKKPLESDKLESLLSHYLAA